MKVPTVLKLRLKLSSVERVQLLNTPSWKVTVCGAESSLPQFTLSPFWTVIEDGEKAKFLIVIRWGARGIAGVGVRVFGTDTVGDFVGTMYLFAPVRRDIKNYFLPPKILRSPFLHRP